MYAAKCCKQEIKKNTFAVFATQLYVKLVYNC